MFFCYESVRNPVGPPFVVFPSISLLPLERIEPPLDERPVPLLTIVFEKMRTTPPVKDETPVVFPEIWQSIRLKSD